MTLRAVVTWPRTFVDTNVLLYAHDSSQPEKQPIATALLKSLWEHRAGVLSTQVLQELYVAATRKLAPPMPRAEAREIVALYSTWDLVVVDAEIILEATVLEERSQLAFWDALIVEAARRAGAARVVSEDFQDGRMFGTLLVENPFSAARS